MPNINKDWMWNVGLSTLKAVGFKYGMTLAGGLSSASLIAIVIPVAATAIAVQSIGSLSSGINKSNLAEQLPIQKRIDDLTTQKESMEQRIEKLASSPGRGAKRKYNQSVSQLEDIKQQINHAKDELNTKGSNFLVRGLSSGYDTAATAATAAYKITKEYGIDTFTKARANISEVYKDNGGGLKGSAYAAYEGLKITLPVVAPGIGMLSPQAGFALHFIAGNPIDGAVNSAMSSVSPEGLVASLGVAAAGAMAKTILSPNNHMFLKENENENANARTYIPGQ